MDYDTYATFEKTIGPVEEKIIRADFQTMVDGNSSFHDEDMPAREMNQAYWVFRHGWICARLAMSDIKQ